MFTEKEFSGYGEETVEHDGIVVKIVQDDSGCDSPREWDNLGTIATWHRRYTIGDEQPNSSPIEHMADLISEYNPKIHDIIEYYEDEYFNRVTKNMEFGSKEIQQEIAEIDRIINDRIQTEFDKYFISLPVYMYDHSGITISTSGFSCPWDSGQLGYIFITHSFICSEYGRKRVSKRLLDMISSFLNEEVKIYSQYINGEVYGYVISKDDEVVDSCFGFYGSDFDSNGLNDEINTIISRQR